MMKQNEPHGGLEQKLAYGQRDKIRFPRLGNFPRLWWHYTQPQQKGQNDDAHSLPDRIDGKWMCVIWRHKKQGKGTNDDPSRSYWWEVNVRHFRAWVQTQWYFSINTASFCMLLGSFRYLHTPRTQSTKQFSHCGGKLTFISCFLPYAHHVLCHLLCSVWRDLRLVRIPPNSVKTLHKTVYEMAEPLWR